MTGNQYYKIPLIFLSHIACRSHLRSPFLCQDVRLGAFDAKRWDSYDEVTFVETLGPHNNRIDNGLVYTGGFGQEVGKVCPIKIERVDLGVRIWV